MKSKPRTRQQAKMQEATQSCPNTLNSGNIQEEEFSAPDLKCKLCSKICVNKDQFDAHMRNHSEKEKEIKRMKKFICPECSKAFSKKINFEVHMELRHMTKQDFKCQICTFSSNQRILLSNHMQSAHIPKSAQVIF